MEKFKPVYDMTLEEVAEKNRIAVEKQHELLQKMEARRTKEVTDAGEDTTLVITPLMRKEAEAREEALTNSLPDKE